MLECMVDQFRGVCIVANVCQSSSHVMHQMAWSSHSFSPVTLYQHDVTLPHTTVGRSRMLDCITWYYWRSPAESPDRPHLDSPVLSSANIVYPENTYFVRSALSRSTATNRLYFYEDCSDLSVIDQIRMTRAMSGMTLKLACVLVPVAGSWSRRTGFVAFCCSPTVSSCVRFRQRSQITRSGAQRRLSFFTFPSLHETCSNDRVRMGGNVIRQMGLLNKNSWQSAIRWCKERFTYSEEVKTSSSLHV